MTFLSPQLEKREMFFCEMMRRLAVLGAQTPAELPFLNTMLKVNKKRKKNEPFYKSPGGHPSCTHAGLRSIQRILRRTIELYFPPILQAKFFPSDG